MGGPFTLDMSQQLESLGFDKASNSTVMGGILDTKTCCKLQSSEVILTLHITFTDYTTISDTSVILEDIFYPPTTLQDLRIFRSKLDKLMKEIPQKLLSTCLKKGDTSRETIV